MGEMPESEVGEWAPHETRKFEAYLTGAPVEGYEGIKLAG